MNATLPSRQIIAQIGAGRKISHGQIVGRSKKDRIVEARFDAIVAVRDAYPSLSLKATGRIFGGRTHATIINALRRRGLR